jgi:hypothetical protein
MFLLRTNSEGTKAKLVVFYSKNEICLERSLLELSSPPKAHLIGQQYIYSLQDSSRSLKKAGRKKGRRYLNC